MNKLRLGTNTLFIFGMEERKVLETGSIYLVVRDFDQSVSFYKQLLEKNVSAQNKTRFAVFNVGNLCLCLLNGKFDAEHPDQVELAGGFVPLYDDYVAIMENQNSGKIVINLGTPDLRKEYERVKGLHIASDMTEIRYINAGSPYWFFCLRDPDGNVIEITGGYTPEGGLL